MEKKRFFGWSCGLEPQLDRWKKGEEIAVLGICGAKRATKIALGSYNHIGFATNTLFYTLGGLGYTPNVRWLEM